MGEGSFWKSEDRTTHDYVATLWSSLASSFFGVSLIIRGAVWGWGVGGGELLEV